MSYEIEADRNQTFLFPPALDDWIPQDHPARFIASFVDTLDLQSLGFEVGHAPTGRPRFSARLLLSVICYCYFSRIRSLRGMEQACQENVALMWLTGFEKPDHNTLWRFWRDNRGPLRGLLRKSVQVAGDMGLLGMVLHAVDGTKIRAQASLKTGVYRKKLKDALELLDKSIREMEEGIEASVNTEIGSCRLPQELLDARTRKEMIEGSLEVLDEAQTNSLNPSEPDARIMKCSGVKTFGYNAQAVADGMIGIVVGTKVVSNETDTGLLATMIDSAVETVGAKPTQTLADKGYSAAQDLADAGKKGHEILVNLKRDVSPPGDEKPFHSSRFPFDAENDCCICPIGGILRFQHAYKDHGKPCRVYHCAGFKECPRRMECSKNKRGRSIKLGQNHQAVRNQIDKQKDPEAKSQLARRSVIVEPVFAIVKEILGFRKWSVQGIEGVQTQWALMCTTVNLRKLYTAWRANLLALA